MLHCALWQITFKQDSEVKNGKFSQYVHCNQSIWHFFHTSFKSTFFRPVCVEVTVNWFCCRNYYYMLDAQLVSIANICNRLCALVAGDLCPAFQALASKLLLLNMHVAIQNKQASCREKTQSEIKEQLALDVQTLPILVT